ncbi:putative esterase [Nakamurella sp. UYEF19]|uniref:alpha/beta hydrolase n=1 Tax=Nakamurella sp. UYEF19 TaxID=1756392 RepID=UPI003398966C
MSTTPLPLSPEPFSDVERARWRSGRLSAYPQPGRSEDAEGIEQRLPDEPDLPIDPDEPVLFVPDHLSAGPVPLVVLFHGATSRPSEVLPTFEEHAQREGFLVLAPKSIDYTWDVIVNGGFGPDVAALDSALSEVFSAFDIDPDRIAIAGISDGASYALSLGLANANLFKRVFAFSPGYFAQGYREGHPKIFISHGREDPVLPIEKTSWRIVSVLKTAGYEVDFREFTGGHEAPADLVDVTVDLLTA